MGAVPVGREGIREVLRAAVERAVAGPGSFLLITGEPGIGKTTLLADVAAYAQKLGLRTAWGWGWRGEGAPALWPWRQVLRDLGLPEPAAHERFQLFDEITSALLAESRMTPVVVLLDDLHWADESSRLLLEFLARRLPAGAITIVAAQRDDVAPAENALVLPLRGLSVDAIGELTGDPAAAAAIHHRTGGNPFLAQQVALLPEGVAGGIPPGATELLRQRFSSLDTDTVGLLARAAAIGSTFSTVLLGQGTLDDAVRARIIAPSGPGEFRFEHDLFWEYAAQQLPAADRARVHAEIGRALASRAGAEPAEVAAHFVRADPHGAEAFEWSVAAAEDAEGRQAYEDAVRHRHHARAAATEEQRPEALLCLAHAHRRAGGLNAARQEFVDSAGLARRTGDTALLAAAALGLHSLGSRPWWPADELIGLLSQARKAVRDEGLRLRVTAALARTLAWQLVEPDRARLLAQEAVAEARAQDDPVVLADCLLALHNVSWLPGTERARCEIAAEVATIGDRLDDPELKIEAHLLAATDLLEAADPGFRAELDEFLRLADVSGQPRLRYAALVRRALLHQLDGRLGEAERFMESAHHLGTETREPGVADVHADQLWQLRTEQGRRAELLDGTTGAALFADPHSPAALCMRALTLLAADRRAEAEQVIAPLRPPAFGGPVGRNYLLDRAMAGELAIGLGHLPTARMLYDGLAPYAGSAIVSGALVSFHGAVDHRLGELAALLGETEAAQRHFADASEIHHRLGARVWEVRSRLALAHLRGDAAEVERITAESGFAANLTVHEGRFTHDGPMWTLEFAGRRVMMKDAKGLHDVATLLAATGLEIAAADLLARGNPAYGLDLGADDVLDERARRQIRARLLDLEEEIAEAEQWSDPQRASNARDDRDALLSALAGAIGLGGRTRKLGDQSERARKAVTARIRDVIARIQTVHPALGQHLNGSITTGTHCAYSPATPVAWQI
jgi:hypothetical protein